MKCPHCHREFCYPIPCEDELPEPLEIRNEDSKVILICPYCEQEIILHTKKSKIYGVFAYYIPNPSDSYDEFPPDDAEIVDSLSGKFGSFDEIPEEFIKAVKKDGANVIAVGKGDHFEIYLIE